MGSSSPSGTLELRGPGDFFGTRQSGVPVFRVGDLLRDHGLMEEARRAAVGVARGCGRKRVPSGHGKTCVEPALRLDRGGLSRDAHHQRDAEGEDGFHHQPGPACRPTSDRLRETLFNILGGDGSPRPRSWTLAPGTGALGLEALSRGAAAVTFRRSRRPRHRTDRGQPGALPVTDRGTVIRGTLPDALEHVDPAVAFDLVLLDPPYEYDDRAIGAILSAVALRTAPGGQVVLERARRAGRVAAAPLRHTRRVKAGDSVLDFHVRAQEQTGRSIRGRSTR